MKQRNCFFCDIYEPVTRGGMLFFSWQMTKNKDMWGNYEALQEGPMYKCYHSESAQSCSLVVYKVKTLKVK